MLALGRSRGAQGRCLLAVQPQKSDLHELSHGSHGNQSESDTTQALAKGINWHMKHWANLLGRLKAAREGDRSVLDNTAAVFSFEGGHGFDPADNQIIPVSLMAHFAAVELSREDELRSRRADFSQPTGRAVLAGRRRRAAGRARGGAGSRPAET
ncbi:MAG: hypothetical protein Q8S42_19620 [Archangium sp.]|nr:hypothetical protein [Archangium sp.]